MAINNKHAPAPTLQDLMTPGFNSSFPETWVSTKAKANHTFPAASSKIRDDAIDALVAIAINKYGEEMQSDEKEKTAMKATKDENVDDLKEYAACITKHLGKKAQQVMLNQPSVQTVVKGVGYAKEAHIGGEMFKPIGCYVGRRNELIFQFEPVDAATYSLMEMKEETAMSQLNGFSALMKHLESGELGQLKNEASVRAAKRAELEMSEKYAEQYSELGFGSW